MSISKRINSLIINGESNELIDGENFEFNGQFIKEILE